MRIRTVYDYGKGLSDPLQFHNHPRFCRNVFFTLNSADAAVRGNDDANRRVFGNYLVRSDFRRFRHTDLIFKPWRCNETFLSVLKLSRCAFHHISDAIHKTDGNVISSVKRERYGFLRHKFRLRGHDRLSGAALRQLILGPLPGIFIIHARDHHGLHKTLDKG